MRNGPPTATSLAARRWTSSARGHNAHWAAPAALLSLLLHGAAIWLLIPHGSPRPVPETPPTFEVELVQQLAALKGDAPATPGTPPPPAALPTPIPATPTTPPPNTQATPPNARPAPAAPAARPTSPAPAGRPAVNLGDAPQDQDNLFVTGDNVVPPRPDAAIRNRPPSYPADAARRGAQGTVRLLIHISETGTPAGIDLAQSSGDASLDRAAIAAVALWRFQPARNNGIPVPFDYTLDIAFRR